MERLRVGHETLFERSASEFIKIDNTNGRFPMPYNLLVSFLTQEEFKSTKFAKIVRKLFSDMRHMFCNRLSYYGDLKYEYKSTTKSLTDKLISFYLADKVRYMGFKNLFS